jgi:formylglycine-generating enzyme required for sulfatase activity/tetratricopeptide (TPR) repeat protein/predicted Ser/Thr protein kinase
VAAIRSGTTAAVSAPVTDADSRDEPAVPLPFSTIGRYQVVSRLGEGGMGTLYLVWDPVLERQIAIKLLRGDDDDLRKRFAREARSVARLRHPNIVTIYDVGDHEGQPFIAMEYIQGQTMAELVRDRVQVPMVRKLELIAELCDGLGFAHRAGIVHRDIKPANIMIDHEGLLKVLDFGIARMAEAAAMTQSGMLVGTLNYMSPEQILGEPIDSRSDIFAVGLVFYEFLSLRPAFPGGLGSGLLHKIPHVHPEPIGAICKNLDPAIVRVIDRCIEKDPARRYQDLTAARKDLNSIRARLESVAAASTQVVEAIPDASPPIGGAATPVPARRTAEREEIARRRAAEIQKCLEEGQQALSAGEFEKAAASCEQALLLDPNESRAIDLLDRAKTALEDRRAREWLQGRLHDAEVAAGEERFTGALQILDEIAQRMPAAPGVEDLRASALDGRARKEDAERRRREIEERLGRASARLTAREWAGAIVEADALLWIDPENAQAQEIRAAATRGQDEDRRKAEEAAERERKRIAEELQAKAVAAASMTIAGYLSRHDLVLAEAALDRAERDFGNREELRALRTRLAELRRAAEEMPPTERFIPADQPPPDPVAAAPSARPVVDAPAPMPAVSSPVTAPAIPRPAGESRPADRGRPSWRSTIANPYGVAAGVAVAVVVGTIAIGLHRSAPRGTVKTNEQSASKTGTGAGPAGAVVRGGASGPDDSASRSGAGSPSNSAGRAGDKSVTVETAGGSAPTAPLTITKPTGGTILIGSDIKCGTSGSNCTFTYPKGGVVAVQYRADPGFSFVAFTGDCARENGRLTMDSARACGATFARLAPAVAPVNPRNATPWVSPEDQRQMIWVSGSQSWTPPEEADLKRDDNKAVTIDGFWLDAFEVTNAAYRKFVVANPQWEKSKIKPQVDDGNYLKAWTGESAYGQGGGELPVTYVNWYAASAFCEWVHKRLPGDAEWEYAARSGTRTRYWWGNDIDESDAERANFGPQLWPVGRAQTRNHWGFFDMLGNVMEWTSSQAVRGGSYYQPKTLMSRIPTNPKAATQFIGFRCAR